jgi:hypothetical protein
MKQKSGPDSSGRTSSEEHSASDTPAVDKGLNTDTTALSYRHA